jgi:transcriptional regulator with XRE-family HTH domain
MASYTGDNLRRLMATRGLTVDQVVELSGLDKRTIQGILDGSNKPHMRTINRLAQGLGVSADEFFLDPAQLLYRQFDHETNPVVQEVIDAYPKWFTDWTAADFAELHSRFGTGGPLTFDGTVAAVRSMNENREAHEWLSVLLESSESETVRRVLRVFYERVAFADQGEAPDWNKGEKSAES